MLAFRRSSLSKLTGLVALGALSLAAYGCSSSDNSGGAKSTSCSTKPSDCKVGTTCWLANTNGDYACLPAKAGAGKGAACSNIVGQAQCDEGLACYPNSSGSAQGVCMPFCDNGGCGPGEACFRLSVQATAKQEIPVCGPLTQTDGGTDSGGNDSGNEAAADSGGNDSGSDAATQDSGSDAPMSDAGASDAATD